MILCKCGCGEEVIQKYKQGKEQLYVDGGHRNRNQQRIRRERLRLAGLPLDPVPAHKRAEYNLNSRLRKQGLDPVAYRQMFERQNGGCDICGAPPPDDRRLAVDHDHDCCPPRGGCSKCIRGLLCWNCNRAIGLLQDNPVWIRAAADYVQREHVDRRKRCKRGHGYDIERVEGGKTIRRCSICRRLLEQARKDVAHDRQNE